MTEPARSKNSATPTVHLNLNVRGMSPSATVAINERCDELRRAGREVFKLGLGQSPFPVPECVVEELRRNAHRKEYLPVRGLRELREAVAGYLAGTYGVDAIPDEIIVGPGSKELMFLLQLVYYGDLVVPTPAWVSYAPQARIIGRHVNYLPTRIEDEWRLTPHLLDSLCRNDPGRPRIVVLNYPSNPTGGSYTADELQEIAEVANRYRLVILSDEIYGRLDHDGDHRSIVPYYPDGTIFSSGLSKWCGAGGWRLGVFAVPERMRWLLEAMAVVASETYTSTSAPIQYAAVRAFQGGEEIETYLRSCRKILSALCRSLLRTLEATGAHIFHPEGGFYLFPDLRSFADRLRRRGITTSRQMCETILEETGVALLPGSDFGRAPEELNVRLAYVDFDGAKALAASREREVDDAFVREHCGRVLDAADRIAGWLRAL